jgi:hypothetical protein
LHIWMRVQYLEKEDNSTRTDRGIRSGILNKEKWLCLWLLP